MASILDYLQSMLGRGDPEAAKSPLALDQALDTAMAPQAQAAPRSMPPSEGPHAFAMAPRGADNSDGDDGYWYWQRHFSGGAPLDQILPSPDPKPRPYGEVTPSQLWDYGPPQTLKHPIPVSPYTNPFAGRMGPNSTPYLSSNPYENPPITDAPVGSGYKPHWADPNEDLVENWRRLWRR